jgi:hypothetical protein
VTIHASSSRSAVNGFSVGYDPGMKLAGGLLVGLSLVACAGQRQDAREPAEQGAAESQADATELPAGAEAAKDEEPDAVYRPVEDPGAKSSTDPQLAKQQAIDAARAAGVLGSLSDEPPPEPKGWWSKPGACTPGTAVQRAQQSVFEEFFCARPDGTKHGRYTRFNRLSLKDPVNWSPPESEVHFVNGKMEGIGTSYHDNGKRFFVINYKNGEANGPMFMYTSDGLLGLEGQNRNGKEHGKHTSFFKDGKRQAVQTYREGVLHGRTTFWNPSGSKRAEYIYSRGTIKKIVAFRGGKRFSGKKLATESQCKDFADRVQELATKSAMGAGLFGGGDLLAELINGCRSLLTAEVVCLLGAESLQVMKACAPSDL